MDSNLKQKNFKRIAEARTAKVLDMMDLIGNLSNTSFYEYNESQVQQIFQAIRKSVEENEKKFTKNGGELKKNIPPSLT